MKKRERRIKCHLEADGIKMHNNNLDIGGAGKAEWDNVALDVDEDGYGDMGKKTGFWPTFDLNRLYRNPKKSAVVKFIHNR